jgi:hypothetical protein
MTDDTFDEECEGCCEVTELAPCHYCGKPVCAKCSYHKEDYPWCHMSGDELSLKIGEYDDDVKVFVNIHGGLYPIKSVVPLDSDHAIALEITWKKKP